MLSFFPTFPCIIHVPQLNNMKRGETPSAGLGRVARVVVMLSSLRLIDAVAPTSVSVNYAENYRTMERLSRWIQDAVQDGLLLKLYGLMVVVAIVLSGRPRGKYEVPVVHAGRSDLIGGRVILMIARMTPPPLAVQMIVDEVGGMIQVMMTQVMIVDVLAPRPQPLLKHPRRERGPRVSAAIVTPIVADAKMIKPHSRDLSIFPTFMQDDVPWDIKCSVTLYCYTCYEIYPISIALCLTCSWRNLYCLWLLLYWTSVEDNMKNYELVAWKYTTRQER